MEEIILGRLQLFIKQLSDLSDKACSYVTLSDENFCQAEIIAAKMQNAIERFNNELNNYFRLVNEPEVDAISEMSCMQIAAEENLVELKVKLKQKTLPSSSVSSLKDSVQMSSTCRLPKLNLPEFDGEIINWHQFWDQFQSNIHGRNIPDVDKLLYLKSCVKGDAKTFIDGLDTTSKNYKIAIDSLKNRYGKQFVLIDAHYSALSKVSISDQTISSYRQTLNEIEKHLRVLESLGEDVNHNHLRHLITAKFPEELVYELKLKSTSDSIFEIRQQLEKIISAREEAYRITQRKDTKEAENYTLKALHIHDENKKERFKRKRNYQLDSNRKNLSPSRRFYDQREGKGHSWKRETKFKKDEKADEGPSRKRRKLSCIFCKEDHYNDQCMKYKTLGERKSLLKNSCYACLRKGHSVRECRNKIKCYYCNSNGHNRALCHKKFTLKAERSNDVTVTSNDTNRTSTLSAAGMKSLTVLQTAVALASKDENSNQKKCRILLDTGSQRSYITAKLATDLKLPVEEEERLSVFTFGAKRPQEIDSSVVKLQLETRTQVKRTIFANVVSTITSRIPSPPNNFGDRIDKRLLADDGSSDCVDVLLGNDYYYNILKEEKIQIKDNLFLVDSEFGWIVSGKLVPCVTDDQTLSVVTYFKTEVDMKLNSPDLPLDQGNIPLLWDIEAIGITDSPAETREEEALKTFNSTTKRINDRYSVSWPWKNFPPDLPNNFGLAFGRLVNLIKRSDTDTLLSYESILKEQIENGIIEEVLNPTKSNNDIIHYLSHHGVKQKSKAIRIVYDASAKTSGNKSLNDCLYCGPLLLEDLTGLLIRFRYHRIALSADVEKAFLQIALNDQDRDVTRFLWVKDITKPVNKDNIKCLRFCRVPFGVISSPFLLNATIKHHLSKEEKLKNIANDIYVDNLITGASSEEEALQLYTYSKETFQQISMNLRQWTSNSKKFMQTIPDATEDKLVKILGLDWDSSEDTLQLRFDIETKANTKRDVLKIIASAYDPCGFAVPQLLRAKLFLQELWKAKFKWDMELPKELLAEWLTICKELEDIKNIIVPRCYLQNTNNKEFQIHCFTDASSKAYAAVVYILHGNKINFIIGKSRLVPIKDQQNLQIPRLELLGVLIGSRLIKFVLKSLRILDIKISLQILWTDSQIVIEWLKTDKLLPPFVSRRVEEVKKNKDLLVRYVPTDLNPADIATRPINSKLDKQVWLSGPQFLSEKQESWPLSTTTTESSFLLTGEGLTNETFSPKRSDVTKNIRSKDKENKHDEQSVKSIRSTTEGIKELQAHYFPREYRNEETDLSRNLNLFKDVDGILRCKGRFKNADWSFDKRYPILIPKESDFTDKIIIKTHNDNYHVGVNHTLSIIRQTFWIPQGKSKVQRLLRKCPRCVKHGGGPFQLPPTPALPPERVNYSAPFTYTGLDYLGPLLVKHQNETEKRWICLFTCLAVRAIHLEVVKDLTAEEGLLALRRMIASRGKPETLTSDNATHFKLMSEVLAKPFCIKNDIKWRFIPQLAPWFGGFYERLIGIVKICMKRTLSKHLLNDTQLCTIIKEIESVVNSRPLTCVDSELEHILKPADFLTVGRCITLETSYEASVNEGTATKTELIKAWKRALVIQDEFKEMFINRYVPSLRERYNNSQREPRVKAKSSPQVGQVVQLKGETKNRNEWKVGKITALPKGADGQSRIAKVNVDGREFTRSIAHLYPLEIENELDEYSYNDQLERTRHQNLNEDEDLQYVDPDFDTEPLQSFSNDNENDSDNLDKSKEDNTHPDMFERSELLDTDERVGGRDQSEDMDAPKERRAAATKALEKIKEWTRDLQCLFSSFPGGSVAN